jgi:hypothetical protein
MPLNTAMLLRQIAEWLRENGEVVVGRSLRRLSTRTLDAGIAGIHKEPRRPLAT